MPLAFPTVTFPNTETEFIIPNWDEMNQLAFEISQQMKTDGRKFDRIVTLAKGGWPMTRSLVDFLEVSEVASIGVKFYSGINQRLDKPSIYQDIPVSIEGEHVLLFDDVADTGDSLLFVEPYLKAKGAASVTTCTLFYKPHSKLTPDYYGAETSAWIIFPYDVIEASRILGSKWLKSGLSKSEVSERFAQLKFPPTWVAGYDQATG